MTRENNTRIAILFSGCVLIAGCVEPPKNTPVDFFARTSVMAGILTQECAAYTGSINDIQFFQGVKKGAIKEATSAGATDADFASAEKAVRTDFLYRQSNTSLELTCGDYKGQILNKLAS